MPPPPPMPGPPPMPPPPPPGPPPIRRRLRRRAQAGCPGSSAWSTRCARPTRPTSSPGGLARPARSTRPTTSGRPARPAGSAHRTRELHPVPQVHRGDQVRSAHQVRRGDQGRRDDIPGPPAPDAHAVAGAVSLGPGHRDSGSSSSSDPILDPKRRPGTTAGMAPAQAWASLAAPNPTTPKPAAITTVAAAERCVLFHIALLPRQAVHQDHRSREKAYVQHLMAAKVLCRTLKYVTQRTVSLLLSTPRLVVFRCAPMAVRHRPLPKLVSH